MPIKYLSIIDNFNSQLSLTISYIKKTLERVTPLGMLPFAVDFLPLAQIEEF